ncbi:MAG TPA: OsmC family protein [Steroidobacteraceae bacterium]|nr:OsmC family protein [Steroidobacteraceae bacterium]
MAHYTAEISWARGAQNFLDNKYSRRHTLAFDGGVKLPGSSSPHVVPTPMSDPTAVDPEELFVASLSNCHMLWFLSIAQKRGFCVDSYVDRAEGVMAKNSSGKVAMTKVTLRPAVQFCGVKLPTREQIDAMHHEAHDECYLANSVKTEVVCEPQIAVDD